MRKYIAIIIASLALFTGQAHAQRCLPKMKGIEVRAVSYTPLDVYKRQDYVRVKPQPGHPTEE